MYPCGFVALSVGMSVAWANKVKGTISWCLGTNEILASNHDIAKGQTRTLWDRHLDSSQFFRLLLRLKVFWSISFKIFIIQTLSTVMLLFKGSYFSVDAASRHFWPNSAIANSTTHVFRNLWVLFHLLQGRVLKIIYFSKFFQWNNDMKGLVLSFVSRLHFDIDRDVSTAHCRCSSGDSVDLLSRTICTTVVVKGNNWYYSYWKIFYLLKMRNLSRNNSVREWIWKKLVDKINRYCFIEWNNMIWVEIYFDSLIIFFEITKC